MRRPKRFFSFALSRWNEQDLLDTEKKGTGLKDKDARDYLNPSGSRGLVLSDLIAELLSRGCGMFTTGMHDEPPEKEMAVRP